MLHRYLVGRYMPGCSLSYRESMSTTSSLLTLALPLLQIVNLCSRLCFSSLWFPQKYRFWNIINDRNK